MTEIDLISIDEILAEANAHGIKIEVKTLADVLVEGGYTPIIAHHMAFNKLVK